MRIRIQILLLLAASAAPALPKDLPPADEKVRKENTASIDVANAYVTPGNPVHTQIGKLRENLAKNLEEKRISKDLHDTALKDLDLFDELVKNWVKLLETHNQILEKEPLSYLPGVDFCADNVKKSEMNEIEKRLDTRIANLKAKGALGYKGEYGPAASAAEMDTRPVRYVFENAKSFFNAYRGRCNRLYDLGRVEALRRVMDPEAREKFAKLTAQEKECKRLVEDESKDNPGGKGYGMKLGLTMDDCKKDLVDEEGKDRRQNHPLKGMGRIEVPGTPDAAKTEKDDPAKPAKPATPVSPPSQKQGPAELPKPALPAAQPLQEGVQGRPFEGQGPAK